MLSLCLVGHPSEDHDVGRRPASLQHLRSDIAACDGEALARAYSQSRLLAFLHWHALLADDNVATASFVGSGVLSVLV